MGSLVSGASALLFTFLLTLLFGLSLVLSQDLSERDALCNADGCFVVYFQRKTFLDSWRACKVKGGNLATIKRMQDANDIATLFSSLDLRHSRTSVQVWIGLQRQPRQCSPTRPLRGFSWTTGDQDTDYTNWQKEDSPSMCSVPRCVVMGYSTQEQSDNFKWLDGSCSVSVDGYLCHYGYKEMCPALLSEGAGNALYTTPFNLLSTLLTHIPFGSVATVPCPAGTKEEQSVLCRLKEDGSVGWSRDSPLCSETYNWCDQNNGGCEHFCRPAGVHFFCECADGYQLGDDGQNCEPSDVCQGAPCEFECLPLSDGYRCACPEGYMLAADERSCLDVDECLQSPCEQICMNAPGTFECRCREGYHPDEDGGCEDIDECINDPCEHACENTLGSHICHCHLGYSLMPEDPSKCQDTDECQIPGTCEQMCVNYEGGFECYCEEGYELMSNHFSCRKIGQGDEEPAVTPPFPWVTNQPGPLWDYNWNPQQGHTDWPPEDEQALDWLTDPPRVESLDPDVIWVTSAPQEEMPIDLALVTPTKQAEKEFYDADWLEWGQRPGSDLDILPTTIYTTPPPPTKSIPTPDWYDEDEEETTTALPFLSTSTISEGAWNWWATSSQKPESTENSVIDLNMPPDSGFHNATEEEEQYHHKVTSPEEEEKELVEVTTQNVPTQPTPSQPTNPSETFDVTVSVQEERGQKESSTWLLVGLLVPICIFIVVMVALCIVYCTRCAVHSRSKNATDCYHWISGAHDKQGAPNLSAGVKTQV
ncbi:CD248 molecule, endosialin a [Trematomus bernacchii]|uniref:CD248 molecule, endosialin a n=1 Tax=Trematomus bernacchii TaxID=40690 RepID=UPI00146AD80B|nr:CD248 molecule, endosialin a [Trematomus bernacchii]